MNINIEKSKDGFLAFGDGVAFFAPTRAEAAAGAIAEIEKLPDDGKEYIELTETIANMHGILKHPDVDVNVVLNLKLQPKAITSPEGAANLQKELTEKLRQSSFGLTVISAAVSDLLTGKKKIIILEQI